MAAAESIGDVLDDEMGDAAGVGGAVNNEEPKVAKVWFRAAIWECSM
jgi:hypothetical protein